MIHSKWFDDQDEVIAFAKWFYSGIQPTRGTHPYRVIWLFEHPWRFEDEHQQFVKERADGWTNA